MLRRKLILNLCPLVALLLLTGVLAVYLLQGLLDDVQKINAEGWQAVEDVNELSILVNAVQSDLYELELERERHLDRLIGDVDRVTDLVQGLRNYPVLQQPQAAAVYGEMIAILPEFQRHVSGLATAQDPALADQHHDGALAAAVGLREQTLPLSRLVRADADREQQALAQAFRWIVLGLAIVFVLLINVSVAVLIRMAMFILRPVDKLVEVTSQLGQEHFDARVRLNERDEFDQLAHAYNDLAERLQTTETRRMETLGQVGLAMNHELNNAIAIIELQLQLLGRKTHGDAALEKCLREINESLRRMTRAVQNLRNVRRIVLTEYVPGIKMLDLERSVADDTSASAGMPATPEREPQAAASS